ncbi:7TM-DISM domain-containing protein [Altibacter sp. HG106]|uniref:7TM-DISM domain-containing protein n=1 Tax=Altibacter sp. HG106 TaxID=3023937 RepID=UPI00234FF4A9|nr:7TM-DISM domain-containing protein [Altibacter sp. HG106]MDC7993691.1 7TM-DISM domain-containing protein [Altibacter sp. HG106]
MASVTAYTPKSPTNTAIAVNTMSVFAAYATDWTPHFLSLSSTTNISKSSQTSFEALTAFEEFSYNKTTASLPVGSLFTLSNQSLFGYGFFYGSTLMLILLNLVCFFLFAQRSYLLHTLSIVAWGLVFFYNDGLLALLDISVAQVHPPTQALLLAISCAITCLFAARFLRLQEYLPKARIISIAFFSLSALLLGFAYGTENLLFTNLSVAFSMSALVLYFLSGIYMFSKKNYAKFFVIAAFIPLLFAIDYFVLAPLNIHFLGTMTFHLKIATATEMIILTYAIMYRMQAIKEENILRQTEMRIFLKRQEVMNVRQKTEKLVEDVYLENLIMHYDLDGLEIKLLQYISEGIDNAKIARRLKVTEVEVEDLTKELYEKLEIGEQIQQDHRMLDTQPDYLYN